MSTRLIISIFCSLLILPVTASAFQGYVQPVGEGGNIAWGNGELSVSRMLSPGGEDGSEPLSPLSIRKAASQARKQLLDIIMQVRIDSKRSVSSFLAESDEQAARVRGVVQNSPLERPTMYQEGGEIRVFETLRGKLAELILPTTIQFQSGIPPKLSTSMEESMAYEAPGPEEVGSGAAGYTGVVVDARGMQVTPCLTPVIYGQDGVGSYGAFLVSRSNAIEKGVAAYATTNDPIVLRERVGSQPLVVRALNAYGSWRTDIVISTPMARLVHAVMSSADAAENCRLVIVVDEPKVEMEEQAPAEVAAEVEEQ